LQDNVPSIRILIFHKNLQGLLVVLLGLTPLSLLLGHPAQVVIGAGLFVAVIVLDLELQGVLIVLLGLLPLPLLMGHIAQLMVDACTLLFLWFLHLAVDC